MLPSQLSSLTRFARTCGAIAAAATLWAGIAPNCQAQNPPPNDAIAKAQALIGPTGLATGTNLFATAETNEPAAFPGSPAGASVWYLWTAPVSMTVDFNTRGSSDPYGNPLDTVLAVYQLKSGNKVAVTNLQVVTQNDDDFSGGIVSRVDFSAVLGAQYLIQVDGSSKYTGTSTNAEGYITLNWAPSLVGGTFQFTTPLFLEGAGDDGFLVQPANDLSPSIHNAQGAPNARITVTRTGGYTGRCEMRLNVTNSTYMNLYFTNVAGTNILMTNYDASGTIVLGFTNILYTNTSIAEEIQDDNAGAYYYLNNYLDFTNTVTVTSSGRMGGSFGEGVATNFTAPLDCFNQTGPVFYVTNVNGNVTNILSIQTNVFCNTTEAEVAVAAAIDGEDYLSSDSTNIIFDDYQMSHDVYLTLPGYFFGGAPPGPDFPDSTGLFSFYAVNADVLLYLTPVPGQVDAYGSPTLLDPLEDPDIVTPTISPSLGSSIMNVMNIYNQVPGGTNYPFGEYATINFERATFRVDKPLPGVVQTNTIWVIRDPPGWPFSSTISYTIDTRPGDFTILTLDDNHLWTPVAGSDIANPSVSGLPDFDFTQTYAGVNGTLTFPANTVGLEPIQIIVTNNGAQEFDSDIYVQLFYTISDASGDNYIPQGYHPSLLGSIHDANVTINFNNPSPGVQPGGAWDRTYDPDASTNSYPPENLLPGANQPVQAVAIEPNGLPIIGGNFTAYNSTPASHVARLTTTGFLDMGFNSSLGSGPNGTVNAVAVGPGGKIYIGGQFTSVNGMSAFHIARLLSTGQLDTTFANGSGFNGTVFALTVDAAGNLLVGGDFTSFNTTNCNHIARLLPSGGLDSTFVPSSGVPNVGADQDVRAIALDSGGNIILGGDFRHINGTNWNYIARLTPNGALDASFNPGIGADNSVYSVAIQPDNSIILGGAFVTYDLIGRGSIARLTPGGALDTTFDPGVGANGVVYSVLLQTNGTILIGGQFTSFNTTRRMALARLLNNGWLDTSFLDTAYNQYAGFINHYYNVYAYNVNDTPAEFNGWNIVSALGFDNTGNVIVGGNFVRVGGGTTRDQIRFQRNLTRLIGAPTPGPETGGLGNFPGNIGLTLNPYTVDDTANKLYVTLDRLNGSLGPAFLSLGTNTLAPGPGAATDADFGLGKPTAEYHDVWDFWTVTPSGSYGWRISDGYFGLNYNVQPANTSDNGASALGLVVHNDTKTLQNLFASLSLLNLNSFGLLTLGGQTIPSGPALGQPAGGLEIINDNYSAGTLGFGATNYTVANNAGTVTVTVLRTNGSTGAITVNYATINGFTNGAGTNTALAGPSPTIDDYVATNGTLHFADGQLSASFTVQIYNHSSMQPTKFFNVLVSDPSGGATLDSSTPPLVPSSTVVEIIDGNFQPGHLEFSSPAFGVLKGSAATITVNRVGGAKGQLTVQCGTSDGTAVNGLNYSGTTNQLSWIGGDVAAKTMTVQTLQDNVVEGAKTVNIKLFNPNVVGSSGGLTNQEVLAYPSNAVLTISDIDSYGALSFSVSSFNVLQNAGQALITVVRTGGLIGTVSVNYAALNGTNAHAPYQPAYAGTNFGAGVSGVLTFGPGVSSQTFTIPIYYTPNETNAANRVVNLLLFNGSAAIASQFPKTANLIILDNQLILSPAGSVDQTTLNGVGFNSDVQSLSLQPDGDLLAGGDFTFFNDFPIDFVARMNDDASYDPTFLNNLAGPDGTVYQVLSQAPVNNQTNGSIMVVGQFSQVDQVNRACIARLNIDGSLDETFNPGAGADSSVYSITQQFLPASQTNLANVPFYVIGGNFANFDGFPSSGVARLTVTGQLDPNFNVGAGVSGSNGAVHVVAIDPNNQILVAGDFTSFNNQPHHHLVRLNVDGSVDTNFAAFDGVSSDINGSIRALQVQPDSRILIGGLFTAVDGSNYNFIARLNHDGTLDTNFNIGVGCNNGVLALALDSQTRILVGGEFTRASGVTRNGITRLNPDGSVDPTINFGFGANGYIDSIVLETNEEIDVAGSFSTFNNVPENNYARLYGGANAGDGSLEFSQQVYGILEGTSNAVITIERLGGEGTAAQPIVSAQFYTSDSATAVSGRNYTGVTNTVVFPYGETFKTVTVPILASAAVAPNAVVNLNLTNATFAGIGPQAGANLIITNNNTGVAFSADSYRQSANASTGEALIPIVRIGNPNSTFQVTVSTGQNGTAAPNTNYVPTTTVITFTPGVLTNYFIVPILNSLTQFGDLTVDLEITGTANAVASAPSSALLTIASVLNAPGTLSFSQTNYNFSEGATNAVITINRTNGTQGTVTVTMTTSALTATNGLNYSNVTAVVTFAPGQTVQTVLVPVLQQTVAGPSVTVLLTLSNPQNGATIGGTPTATLTIINNFEFFSFGSPSYFVNESAGTLTVSILRNGPATTSASVSYATFSPANANDTNGYAVPNVDYVPVSGTLTFGPGSGLQTIPISIIQGNTVNGVESFQVILKNPSSGAQLGYPSATQVGIISDVAGFALATNAYFVGENGSNVVVTVNRINPNTGAVSVRYATSDNTAIRGVDYVATNGTLNFQNGQSSTTFSVQILNPNIVEVSKNFNVFLTAPSANSYLVSPSNAVVVITNVNAGFSFASPSFNVSECGVLATIPVIRTGVANQKATVDFGTADNSGIMGINYFQTNGTLTFLPGETVHTFDVQVINNHVIGPDHTAQLNLSNAVSAQLINPSSATLTIEECNGAFIVGSGTAFVNGSINPGTGVIYPNDVVTILLGLRDIAGGDTANLIATLLQTNGVTNVVAAGHYGKLIQNGPTKSVPFTFTAAGTNGQNIVATLALQDGARDLGEVAFGLTIGGSTLRFTNSQPLTFEGVVPLPSRATNSSPPGFGYPSVINVSGVVGTVTAVTATFSNFSHTFPENVNVVLEAPEGQDSIIMSHCGSSDPVSGVNLTFSQTAATPAPTTSALVTGTYLPTANTSPFAMTTLPTVPNGEPFLAPAGPYTADFDVFTGASPDGNWELWIDDDDELDNGSMAGWILQISIGTQVENDSDLQLTVTPSTTNAALENEMTYFVTLTNYGPSTATNVVISNAIPSGMTYVGNTCNCGGALVNGVLTFTYPSLAVGQGTAFGIVLLPSALGYSTNTVIAYSDQPNRNSNNIVTTNVLVNPAEADVGVSITEFPDPILAGAGVNYLITVTNDGPAIATAVSAVITIPEGFSVTSILPSGKATNVNGTITWNIASLAVNSTATLTVGANALAAGTVLATASVSSSIYDPTKVNNFASVKTEVDQPALSVTLSGQSYALTWPSGATNFMLEGAFSLPPVGTWVPITNPAPQVVSGQYIFTLPGAAGYSFFRLATQTP